MATAPTLTSLVLYYEVDENASEEARKSGACTERAALVIGESERGFDLFVFRRDDNGRSYTKQRVPFDPSGKAGTCRCLPADLTVSLMAEIDALKIRACAIELRCDKSIGSDTVTGDLPAQIAALKSRLAALEPAPSSASAPAAPPSPSVAPEAPASPSTT